MYSAHVEAADIRAWIEAGAALVQALAVPAAAFFALRTFANWRRQRTAERNAELAEELEITLVNLRKAVERIRNPFGFRGEGSTRAQGHNETREEAQRLDIAFAHYERIDRERDLLQKLEELEIKAGVRFRGELADDLEALRRHLNSLTAAAVSTYRWARRNRPPKAERAREAEKVLWSDSANGELDDFDAKQHEIVARIVEKLQRHKF